MGSPTALRCLVVCNKVLVSKKALIGRLNSRNYAIARDITYVNRKPGNKGLVFAHCKDPFNGGVGRGS